MGCTFFFYFIFVQFMQFPVLHFGLAHSGSRPFNFVNSAEVHCTRFCCRILSECRKEAGQDDLSSDEEPTDESTKQPAADCVISDEQYKRMLKSHRQKKLLRKVSGWL